MSNIKKLFNDIVTYGLMSGISKSIVFVLLPVLTRYFTPEEYGVIDIVTSLVSFLSIIITLSLESAVMRLWGDANGSDSKSKLVFTSMVSIFIFGVLFIFGLFFISRQVASMLLSDAAYSNLILSGSVAALSMALGSIPLAVLRMQRKIVAYNMVGIVQTVTFVSLTLLFVLYLDMDEASVFYSMIASYFFALLLGLILIRKYLVLHFSIDALRDSLNFSLPLVPAVLVTWFNNQADKYLLLIFLGLSNVGVFGASAKVAAILALVITIFRQAWTPLSMNAINENETTRNNFYHMGLLIYTSSILALGAVLVAFSREILGLMVPLEYQTGFIVIPWLIGAKVLHGSTVFTNLGTIIRKKTGINAYAAFIGAFFNITLGLFLIPKHGILGASIGALTAELIFTSILGYFSQKFSTLRFDTLRLYSLLAVYIIFSLFVTFYMQNVFYRLALLIVLFVIYGSIISKEINHLWTSYKHKFSTN